MIHSAAQLDRPELDTPLYSSPLLSSPLSLERERRVWIQMHRSKSWASWHWHYSIA